MPSDALLEIYDQEMRQRVTKLRLALALAGSADARARAEAMYDAHLQAHTIKGTSEQLGFQEVATMAARMVTVLEQAREKDELEPEPARGLDRASNALVAWLDDGRKTTSPLTIATAALAAGAG
jgi:chemotaxis protein histidine kinase CheA